MIFSMFSVTSFIAGWTMGQGENSSLWWYDLGNGSYYAGNSSAPSWQWLDGNQDGVAECYAFNSEERIYVDTTTPDGYQVNKDGAWIVGGIIQIQNQTLNTTKEVMAEVSKLPHYIVTMPDSVQEEIRQKVIAAQVKLESQLKVQI